MTDILIYIVYETQVVSALIWQRFGNQTRSIQMILPCLLLIERSGSLVLPRGLRLNHDQLTGPESSL